MHWLSLGVVAFCLGMKGFLSATETALSSLPAHKIKHLRGRLGEQGAVLDLWLSSQQRVFISILVFKNVFNAIATILVYRLISEASGSASEYIAGFLCFAGLLFVGVVPKSFARNHAARIVVPLLGVYRTIYWPLLPITQIFYVISEFCHPYLVKWYGKRSVEITEDELAFLINDSEEQGIIAEEKHEMLSGVFELGDTLVREIMVHRNDMTAVPHTRKIADLVDLIKERGLSRLPVYKDKLDNIIGIIHAKDILFYNKAHPPGSEGLNIDVSFLLRPPMFFPETKAVDSVFQEMRRKKQHLAIAVDEYGTTAGLITMEDIFEEIVGEVRDEFDNEEDTIRATPIKNQFVIDCKIHLDDFCDYFDMKIEEIIESEHVYEFDTLGGLIMHHFGLIPKIGDRLNLANVQIEVLDVSRRRVRRVLAKLPDQHVILPPQKPMIEESVALKAIEDQF